MHFPPPFVYVAGFLAGWLMQRRWPWFMTSSESWVRDGLADVLFVLWLTLMGWAMLSFWRARTTLIPNRPASQLVTSGPYRISRNPMYVGLAALYVVVALWLNSWWPLIFLPLVLAVITRVVILREEHYLAGAFPEEYAAYRQRVRRWL
ncbi:MAG: isoprenylcysteine carboxylmethyltransferase family protein [Gemmatimonadaceae bacterium]